MRPLDHVSEPEYLPFFALKQGNGQVSLAVNAVHLLSFPQVLQRLSCVRCCHPVGHADAGSATIEAQHQAGAALDAAMVDRIDAKRSRITIDASADDFLERKTRAPHQ